MLKFPLPQREHLRYYSSMLMFLGLIWTVTLGWFIGHLKMQFSIGWVLFWFSTLLLTLLVSLFLSKTNSKKPKQEGRRDSWLWMLLLMWVMLLNSALLYETGGTINPLIHLLLLPLALGMLLLPSPYFMILAVFSGLLYLVLNFYYVPIMSLKVHSLQAFFAWHLHGSMLVFMLLVLFLALFILPMKMRLDKQQSILQQHQRNALESEYLLSVASIASASAHQLSTPLNTLTLLQDLLKQEVHSVTGRDYLKTMQEQLNVCTQALQNLQIRADYANKKTAQSIPFSRFLKELKQEFALLNPQSSLKLTPENVNLAQGCILADPSLKLALMNLLDNAARHSPHFIGLDWQVLPKANHGNKRYTQLVLIVRDQGGGIPPEQLDYLGKEPVKSSYGLGMGIFLTRMIVQRFQGKITFKNYDSQQIPIENHIESQNDLDASNSASPVLNPCGLYIEIQFSNIIVSEETNQCEN
ncbi:sensor histidine kinase [Thiomicrorhabdus indica]|uniref:sensor histidine kinase n=1 Tax=Thiomicrorhabdus indica TaxID=2267253 RepID=UPI00102DD0B6|nr:HAMP domain-containing sensor histidine kinase [Thiomicrorhabdus indica]